MGKFDEVLRIVEYLAQKTEEGTFVYRGISRRFDKVSSRIYRKYEKENVLSSSYTIVDIEKDILERLKISLYKQSTSNIEILSDLQHFGGHTSLIDFTKNMFVALFFACNADFNRIGEIVFLDCMNLKAPRDVYGDDQSNKDDLLVFQPTTLNNRILFQSSVFIHSSIGYISKKQIGSNRIPIKTKDKISILEFLSQYHDINHQSIFHDLHGYIQYSNLFHDYQVLLYRAKSLIDASPQEALTCIGSLIRNYPNRLDALIVRSDCYFKLNEYKKAIEDIEDVIKKDANPMYFFKKAFMHIKLCEFSKALECCFVCLQSCIKDDHSEKITLFKLISLIYFRKNDTVAGKEFIHRALIEATILLKRDQLNQKVTYKLNLFGAYPLLHAKLGEISTDDNKQDFEAVKDYNNYLNEEIGESSMIIGSNNTCPIK